MRIAPFRHIYNSPVARRIYFMYGDVYRFEHINRETMERAVPSFFGNSNMTFFEHMGVMVRAGRALDARGRDTYLANLDAFKLPIEFVTGEHNRMFMPESLRRTHEALRKAHGPRLRPPRDPRLRAPRPVARHERRARRLADRAGRAGAPQLSARWAARPLQLPADVGAAGPPHAPRGAGRVAAARRPAVRERQRSLAAEPARGGDPDRLDVHHRRGHARRPDRAARRLARVRDDVPRRRGPGGAERRQRTRRAFFMVNDEGVWLIERPRGQAAAELLRSIPPRWEDRTEADWLAFADAVKRKVHDGRLAFPSREWPHYMAWNGQFSNVPGTTCFLPMVDVTRQYINGLLILLSEPIAPLFVDDWQRFKPSGAHGVGGVGGVEGRARGADPVPADRRDQARARRLGRPEAAGAAEPDRDRPQRLRGALPAPEPDAHRRGAAARRLGPRRADDPVHLAARSRRRRARARLPRARRRRSGRALAAVAAGAGLAAELRRDRRRARGPVPAVRDRHGRGGRPGARGEVRRRRRVRRPRRVRPGVSRSCRGGAVRPRGRAPVARDDRLRQGDLPLHRRDLRAVPGPLRRVPPARHLGPVLASGDRVLRALRGARARAAAGRGPGSLGRR